MGHGHVSLLYYRDLHSSIADTAKMFSKVVTPTSPERPHLFLWAVRQSRAFHSPLSGHVSSHGSAIWYRVNERRVSRRHLTGVCRLQRIRNNKKNMTDPQSWHLEILLKTIFCGANETITVTIVLLTWTQVFKHACFNSLSFNKHHLLWEVNLENSQ